MKTLYPKQQEAADFFLSVLRDGKNTLDSSDVGTGKTVVASYIAKHIGRPIAVICPKAVIVSWQRELADAGIDPVFVMNYEKIRNGKTPYMSKRGKKIMRWNLPEGTIVFCDEAHKMKGPYTLNSQMLISLVQQKHNVHMMSATACESPIEMRAIGYALGLHSLNQSTPPLRGWYGWLLQHGCWKNRWGGWELRSPSKLNKLHDIMYANTCKRLTVADFPDSFKANRVFIEPIQFQNAAKIRKAYEEEGVTPSIIEAYLASGTVEDSEWVMVNLLRARQLAESYKIKDMVDMARDLVEQHKSVAIFVNFDESVEALRTMLQCGVIKGGQSAAERQNNIDRFQRDEDHILVVNSAAGGTGVSLHDVSGKRQRISLISPSFNTKEYMQTLGRIHRNGAKSDAIQKVLVASDTVEEHVIEVVQNKIANLRRLH